MTAPFVHARASHAARIVRWEQRWQAPDIESACPSCGRVAVRSPGSWRQRVDQGTGERVLIARLSCWPLAEKDPACWRTFDTTLTVPDEHPRGGPPPAEGGAPPAPTP